MNAHAAATIKPMVWKVMVPTIGISELPTVFISIYSPLESLEPYFASHPA